MSGHTGFTSPEFGSELETTDSGVAAFSSQEQLLVAILLACMLKMEQERGKEISSKAFRDCVIIGTCKDRIDLSLQAKACIQSALRVVHVLSCYAMLPNPPDELPVSVHSTCQMPIIKRASRRAVSQ